MFLKTIKGLLFMLPVLPVILYSGPVVSDDRPSLIQVTPAIQEYAVNTVQPVLDSSEHKDELSLLLKISQVLIDPETGVQTKAISPEKYIYYDKLNKLYLGFLVTVTLSTEQANTVRSWHSKYMQDNPADVFFAPSADDIIKSKAAFGCSHYARAFMAVVKALGLVKKPEHMRYAVSCKADNYNRALDKKDKEMTINGHQFVMVKIESEWIAINTSKAGWTAMPAGFSPDFVTPPYNIPVRFKSYPGVTFLLRKTGKDYDDDCCDNTLNNLMNIYRSGNVRDSGFKWERFPDADTENR